MPGDAVVVDVVQDAQAGLVGAVDVELSVVRLSGLLVARGRPGVVAPAGRHLEHGEVVRASLQRGVWRRVGHLIYLPCFGFGQRLTLTPKQAITYTVRHFTSCGWLLYSTINNHTWKLS